MDLAAARHENEARLALALEVSGQALYELDLRTGQVHMSLAGAQMLERDPSNPVVSLATWSSWLHPDDRDRVLQLYEDCVAGRLQDVAAEFRLRSGSGHWIWVRSVARVFQWDETGRPLRLLGTHMDITESKEAEKSLRFTQTIVDQASIGVFWFDAEGRLIYVNEEACRSLGYTRDELLGASVEMFDPDFGLEQASDLLEQLSATGNAVFETRHRRKDGSSFFVEIVASYLDVGDKGYQLAIARDITSQKLAEVTLREHNQFLENLDRISRVLSRPTCDVTTLAALAYEILDIFQVDRVFFMHPCDPNAAIMSIALEVTRSESPGTLAATRKVESNASFKDVIRQALANNAPVLTDFDTDSAAFCEHTIRSQMAIALHPRSNQPWLLGLHQFRLRRWSKHELQLFEKIAERVGEALSGYLLLERLRDSEARYRDVFENSLDAIIVHDAQGAILAVNQTAMTTYVFGRDEALQSTIANLSAPENSTDTLLDLWKRVMDGETARFEWAAKPCHGGESFPVEVTLRSIQFGDQPAILANTRDITERKQVEQELQRHREHLEELVNERTTALQQAMNQLVQAEKLAALGNLVAGVAHELNTPLGNTRIVASTLKDHFNELDGALKAGALHRSQLMDFLQSGQEAIDLLERNIVRAADLISHFKEVAVDQTSMRRRRFDLGQIINEVLMTLRPTLKHTAHRIELDFPPNLELDSYPGPLEQVITNLINNSLTHGFAGMESGCIQIRSLASESNCVLLSYSDNGVGIPLEMQARVFDPFFTTRLGQGGSGLGLYLVYNLVTGVLGGTIEVKSKNGQGTNFMLTLPRQAPDDPP
ncbi:PAS domain S-box protein [Rhabdochromatium marinum]|uniref:PAS domain S-box protein n=1 Tax=Rhabdochromatium marinum TaxID=48729 RepID=UPI001906E5FA|nr:PAS domain S-box protein [Rhabdochromatium marinum]MBK1649625.1 hypothetical protein [Rhabdochromatium marinum]